MQTWETNVFTADTRDLDCETLVADLSADCLLRLARISHSGRRAQFILGRILLRHALLRTFGPMADAWRLEAARGKPYLVGIGAPKISLSHSRHLVACALAPVPVGLDVEYCRERDYAALVAQMCGPIELHRFLSVPTAYRTEAFYRIWTRLESSFKLNGGYEATREACHTYFQPEPGFVGALATHAGHPIRLVLHPRLRGEDEFKG